MSKPGRPNLSLAGKREAPTQAKAARGASTSTRGQRGRGGRGRGGGPRQKQELIQTGGVFSEGLGGDFPSRKKQTDVDVAQFSYSKRDGKPSGAAGGATEKPEKAKVTGEGKASFEGWDALWCSDEEGDLVEMRALRPEGFISDLRRGTVMPVVLPHEDEPQFKTVLNKSARLSLEEDDELPEHKVTGKDQKESTKLSAEQIVQILEASTKDLLHLQLPSVVATLCNQNLGPSSPTPMETDEIPAPDTAPLAPPTNLPMSETIGKLQVTQKGKLRLQIAGHYIDISTKKQTGKEQGTVLMEVEPTTETNMMNEYQNQQFKKFENQLYHVGMVKHNLVGSMQWSDLKEEKKAESDEVQEETIDDGITVDSGKLEVLQKEQADWSVLANRWARGVI